MANRSRMFESRSTRRSPPRAKSTGRSSRSGAATVNGGALVTSFSAYQPRTFAVKLAAPPAKVAAVHSAPVTLHYDLATASNDGTKANGGI